MKNIIKHAIINQAIKQSSNQAIKQSSNQAIKQSSTLSKEDIFYYIYGLLHSKDYRARYQYNLDKDLPRIPLVPEFFKFSNIGRKLSDLHLNYEEQPFPTGVKILKNGQEIGLIDKNINPENKNIIPFKTRYDSLLSDLSLEDLKVKKMKINKKDKSKIEFNDSITISNIPKTAWDYQINDWPAIKWIVERYQYKKDQKTNLVNNPNTYSQDPQYVLKLLLSVITVSIKTCELVDALPSIDFDKLSAYKISSNKKIL